MRHIVKMSKVVKDDKTYYNVYLFGVAVKPVNQQDYTRLHYSLKEYCAANELPIEEITKVVDNDKVKKAK